MRFLPSLAIEPEPDLPPMPPKYQQTEMVPVVEYVPSADPAVEVQIVKRKTLGPDDRLVDFAVMLESRNEDEDAWLELLKIDTSHRFVHVHEGSDPTNRRTEFVPPDCRCNIDRAYAWAVDYIWERAEGVV